MVFLSSKESVIMLKKEVGKMYLPSESEEHWEHKVTFGLLSVLLLNADSAIKSRLPF